METGRHTSDTTLYLLLIGHLLVCRDPGMNDERLAVADIGQMTGHLQVIYYRPNLLDFSGLKGYQLGRTGRSQSGPVLERFCLTTPKVKTPPAPFGSIFFASSWSGCDFRPG